MKAIKARNKNPNMRAPKLLILLHFLYESFFARKPGDLASVPDTAHLSLPLLTMADDTTTAVSG
jgi:hypothetical protein